MIKHFHFTEISSTNDMLHQLEKEHNLDEGSMVTCDFQLAGRGVNQNIWESEYGANILCSLLLRPHFLPIKEQFIISQVVSLSIIDILKKYFDSNEFYIKWPNDIYFKNKKIAGILIENNLANGYIDACIVGIGLNVNQTIFMSSAPNPISLCQLTGKPISLKEITIELRNAVFERYIQLIKEDEKGIQDAYHDKLYRKQGFHLFEDANGTFSASIEKVSTDGYLILKLIDNSERKYAFKEVSFILP